MQKKKSNTLILKFNSTVLTLILSYMLFIKKYLARINKKFLILGLPNRKKLITLLKSPHVNKKAREQFIFSKHSFILVLKDTFSFYSLNFILKNIPAPINVIVYK
jgi:ribosomal protein S10